MENQNSIGRFTDSYSVFSGSDIVCTFDGVPIGSLMGIMWSITREKMPVYTMGSPNPRAFSRGKRGIAGTLMFTVFDRPGLYKMLEQADPEEVKYFTRSHNKLPGVPGSEDVAHRGIVPVTQQNLEISSAVPYYADQIPPFDITITFANEYGQTAVRSIYGVEILNEGSGASVDDVQLEETMTFVARDCGPMIATQTVTGNNSLGAFNNPELEEFDGVFTPGLEWD